MSLFPVYAMESTLACLNACYVTGELDVPGFGVNKDACLAGVVITSRDYTSYTDSISILGKENT